MSEQPIEEVSLQRVKVQLRGWVKDLRVHMHDGHVVLRGIAFSYYAKQLAQHCFLDSLGVTLLVNEIEVQCVVQATALDDLSDD